MGLMIEKRKLTIQTVRCSKRKPGINTRKLSSLCLNTFNFIFTLQWMQKGVQDGFTCRDQTTNLLISKKPAPSPAPPRDALYHLDSFDVSCQVLKSQVSTVHLVLNLMELSSKASFQKYSKNIHKPSCVYRNIVLSTIYHQQAWVPFMFEPIPLIVPEFCTTNAFPALSPK